MTNRVPNVISGPRGPEDRMNILRPHDSGERPATPSGLQGDTAQAGVPLGVIDEMEKQEKVMEERESYRYRSMHINLIVLLYAEPDSILPGGKIVRGRIYQAKFRDGEWETKSGWRTSTGELISHEQQNQWIRRAESFSDEPGKGGFWDADVEKQFLARTMYASFVSAIRSDPKLKEMLRKDLSAADFDVVDALAKVKENEKKEVVE